MNSDNSQHVGTSDYLIQQSLQRIAKAKRRESLIRYSAVLTGIFILVMYLFLAALTGLPGIGLLCVPFAVWLILLGVMAIVAAFMAEHS